MGQSSIQRAEEIVKDVEVKQQKKMPGPAQEETKLEKMMRMMTEQINKNQEKTNENFRKLSETIDSGFRRLSETIDNGFKQLNETLDSTSEAVSYTHLDVYKRQIP